MVQSPKCAEALTAYRRKQAEKKAARLVKYAVAPPSIKKRVLWKDEANMDIDTIEAYIDHTLEIETDDIGDRTKAVGPALSLMKLKKELATKAEVTSEEDDAIKTILQAARKVNSK